MPVLAAGGIAEAAVSRQRWRWGGKAFCSAPATRSSNIGPDANGAASAANGVYARVQAARGPGDVNYAPLSYGQDAAFIK